MGIYKSGIEIYAEVTIHQIEFQMYNYIEYSLNFTLAIPWKHM